MERNRRRTGVRIGLVIAAFLLGTPLRAGLRVFSDSAVREGTSGAPPASGDEDPAREIVPGVGTRLVGGWTVLDGETRYEGRFREALPVLPAGFRDGRVAVRCNGHTAGLVLRSGDSEGRDGVWLVIRPSLHQAYWFVRRGGVWHGKRGLTRLPGPRRELHLLEVDVEGERYRARVDGVTLPELRDATFREGGVLLHAWWHGRFQDLNLAPAAVERRGPPKSHLFVRLFSGRNFTGDRIDLVASHPDLTALRFGGCASSVQVFRGPAYEEGDEALLFGDPGYARPLGSLTPGFHPNLPRGLADRIHGIRLPGAEGTAGATRPPD